MTAINFKHGFDEYVKAHQKVWQHDRSKSCGASEVFGCLRKVWFGKNGAQPDPDHKDSWGALQRGDVMENYWVEPVVTWFLGTLKNKKTKMLYSGKSQKTFVDGRLSATPDGLVINADDDALAEYGIASLGGTGCFCFEIKSIDPRVSLKEEKAIHRGQTQVQMGLIRQEGDYRPNYAVIIYVDASFYDDIDIFVVPFNQETFESAQRRADAVFGITNPKEILPEGKIDGSCDLCKFTKACNQVNEVYTPTDGKANIDNTPFELVEEFSILARRERDANAAAKIAAAAKSAASEDLKHWFRDIGVKRAESVDGDIKASISWVKGKKTYDIEAMRAAGIDVEEFAVQGDGHDRLYIKEKGSSAADDDT